MPHPDYFPYDSISAQVLPHDAYDPNASSSSTSTTSSINRLWNWLTGAANDNKRLEEINIPKFSSGGLEDVQLSVALQYSKPLFGQIHWVPLSAGFVCRYCAWDGQAAKVHPRILDAGIQTISTYYPNPSTHGQH